MARREAGDDLAPVKLDPVLTGEVQAADPFVEARLVEPPAALVLKLRELKGAERPGADVGGTNDHVYPCALQLVIEQDGTLYRAVEGDTTITAEAQALPHQTIRQLSSARRRWDR